MDSSKKEGAEQRRLADLAKGQSVGTFISQAKLAAQNSCCWSPPHTLRRQRQCQRQTERLEDAFNQRPPAAHPVRPSVRPSTSMINCRSMHFKNVNLSYMPRSIRLSPQKETDRQRGRQIGQGTDRERQTERQSRSSKRKENLCKKMLQTSYRNQIKNV